MSWSIALRRSPKPGALTATALKVPRSLLTTRVASASPSTSSAMITSGLPHLDDLLEDRAAGPRSREIFLSVMRMYGSSSTASMRCGIGDHVRGDVAPVELHALDELELGLEALRLLDGDDAVLADLLHRVGDHLADLGVAGGDRGDLGDLLALGDGMRLLADRLDDRLDAELDAALAARLGWRRRRRSAGPRRSSPGPAPWRWWCRRRRCRWSWSPLP